MDAATLLRRARHRGPYTLRELAARAGTSHATISAYESGRKVPSVATLDRLLRAAGVELAEELTPVVGGPDAGARGRELIEVLELAAMFPAEHEPELRFPRFGPA